MTTTFAGAPQRSSATPAAPAAKAPLPEDPVQLQNRIHAMLQSTPAYRALSVEKQGELTRNLGKVTAFLSDPAAGQKDLAPLAKTLAKPGSVRALADETKKYDPKFHGDAAHEGGSVMAETVKAVNFPAFVSSLIEGVFTSIVDSSIKQMKEYGKFLEAVVKSVEDFAQDHISMPQAKQYLADKFPKAFKMESGTSGSDLTVADSDQLPDLKSTFGLDEDVDAESEEGMQKVVVAAQLELARMRQQQLAAMVMMGINRIVVTDGKINAKVVIDVKTKDTTHEDDKYHYDRTRSKTENESSSSGWWGGDESSSVETTVSTVNYDQNSSDERKIEMKANLTGEVTVNFKSDFFPLEKMTSPAQLTSVQGKSQA